MTKILKSMQPMFGFGDRLPIIIYDKVENDNHFEVFWRKNKKMAQVKTKRIKDVLKLLKTPLHNMIGYTLKIPAFNFSQDVIIDENNKMFGVQGKLLDAFCEHFEIKYQLLVSGKSSHFLTRIHQQFLEGTVDFSMNYVGAAHVLHRTIKNVITNEFVGMCMVVPRNERRLLFSNFFSCFDIWIWILLLNLTIIMIPLWKFLSRQTGSRFTWNFIVLNIFRYFIRSGATGENRMGFREKIIIYLYMILTAFTSRYMLL